MNRKSKRLREVARHRKAVLCGFAGFVLLQAALVLAVRHWLPQIHDPEYGWLLYRLRHRLEEQPTHQQVVLMLGSSRTYHGFRAGKVEKDLAEALDANVLVFNCGLPGGGPVTELLTLNRLLADGIRPDLLLIEVTPVLLADDGRAPVEKGAFSQDRAYREDLEILKRYSMASRKKTYSEWQSWIIPWYRYRVNILNHVAPRWLTRSARWDWIPRPDETGWRYNDLSHITAQQRQEYTRAAYGTFGKYLRRFRLGKPACAALRDLLSRCRDEGIPAALVLMPEGSDFQQWYPPKAWEEMVGFLSDLGEEYDAPLINARDWIEDEHFSDSHHLTVTGADLFSERFGREAVIPLFERAIARKPAKPAAITLHSP